MVRLTFYSPGGSAQFKIHGHTSGHIDKIQGIAFGGGFAVGVSGNLTASRVFSVFGFDCKIADV